jgi:hypothetical protein
MSNNSNSNNNSNGGIGFAGLLTVAFIVLKLMGVIAWSWWWVLSPIWITILLIIAMVVLSVIVKLFCE